jgi:5-formyltetrahydrofolate cyclo-ligase
MRYLSRLNQLYRIEKSSMQNPINRAIRKTCLDIRKQLPLEYQHKISSKICNRIRLMNEYRYAKRIALYHAINREVDLSSIWRSAPLHGKYCYLPAINPDGTLSFLPATPNITCSPNQYGILEPNAAPGQAISPATLDIIFTPLVAFDTLGKRLGMGKGFYDKTLANERPKLLLGLGYEFQRQDLISLEPWDILLDAVITERTIYWNPNID